MGHLSSRAQEVLRWANNLTKRNGPFIFPGYDYGLEIPSNMIREAMVDKYLYTAGLLDVDLLIRQQGPDTS